MKYYILDDEKNIVETDVETWAKWIGTNRVLKHTEVGGRLVSTIFMGLDHNFSGSGAPILFESMSFSISQETGQMDHSTGDNQTRYATYEEAMKGHDDIVKELGG